MKRLLQQYFFINGVRVAMLLVVVLVTLGCHSPEDTEIKKRLKNLEKIVAQLQREIEQCKKEDSSDLPQIEHKIDTIIDHVQTLKNKTSAPTPIQTPPPVPLQEPDTVQQILPVHKNDASKATIGLSKEEVSQILNQSKQKIQLCGFQGGTAITLRFRIATTGRVLEAQALRPHIDSPLGHCAAKVVYGIPFSGISKEASFSHTFTF